MDKLKSDEQLLRELACTSHGCYVLGMAGLDQRGMGTNSVCKCPKRDFSPPHDLLELQRMMMLVRRIRDTEVKRLREDISDMVNERNEEVLALLALRVEYPKLQRTASELRVEVERLREDISDMVNERNEEVLGLLALREKHGAHAWETIGLFVERLVKERTSAEASLTRLVKRLEEVESTHHAQIPTYIVRNLIEEYGDE